MDQRHARARLDRVALLVAEPAGAIRERVGARINAARVRVGTPRICKLHRSAAGTRRDLIVKL